MREAYVENQSFSIENLAYVLYFQCQVNCIVNRNHRCLDKTETQIEA
jgi:hypothetical protein